MPPPDLERLYDEHARALFAFLLNFTRTGALPMGKMGQRLTAMPQPGLRIDEVAHELNARWVV